MAKILTTIKKIGGSFYVLMPPSEYRELNIDGDDRIIAEFDKFKDVLKENCEKFSADGKSVIIRIEGHDIMEGVIAFVDRKNITILSNDKYFILPYSCIENIEEKQ